MISKLISFIREKIISLNTTGILLLCAQEGDAKEQLKLSKIYFQQEKMVEAYAWADVASYQGLQEAKIIRDRAWKYVPDTDKFQAQNLARKYRLNHTRASYLEVK